MKNPSFHSSHYFNIPKHVIFLLYYVAVKKCLSKMFSEAITLKKLDERCFPKGADEMVNKQIPFRLFLYKQSDPSLQFFSPIC